MIVSSNTVPPVANSLALLKAECSNTPTGYNWGNCASGTSLCEARSPVAGVQTYSVSASNAGGTGPAVSTSLSWQASPPPPPGRSARFQAWAESLKDHPEATKQVLDAFNQNLYGPGFVYCVDRAFVSTCTTPCLVLAGNDEAHPLPISEELAKLLPNCEFIREWKTGDALTSARARVTEFLSKHTP